MAEFDPFENDRPLGYFGRHPVYFTTLIVASHVAALLGCTLLFSFNLGGVVESLHFSSDAVRDHLALWQFFTYPFAYLPHSIGALLLFALQMYFFVWMAGREIERFLGRRTFATIYFALILVTPVLLTLVSFVTGKATYFRDNSMLLHLSLIVVYARIYPAAEFGFIIVTITARWVAILLLAIFSINFLALHQWTYLLALWASAAVAYFGTGLAGVGDELPLFANLRQRLQARSAPRLARTKVLTRGDVEPIDALDSVDPVLEKISKHGMSSLTQSERATLERARASLLKRKGREP